MRFIERIIRCRHDHLLVDERTGFWFVAIGLLRLLYEIDFDLLHDFTNLLSDSSPEDIGFTERESSHRL